MVNPGLFEYEWNLHSGIHTSIYMRGYMFTQDVYKGNYFHS